jgi:hypothetical protein
MLKDSTRPLAQIGLPNDEQKAQTRTRVVLAAMVVQENRVLHTIHLEQYERDENIYAESILPHLKTNLYRARVLSIKKADIQIRRHLLGLALQTKSVRNTKSNLLWMFLSGNQDIVLQSDEESSEQEEEAVTRKRKLWNSVSTVYRVSSIAICFSPYYHSCLGSNC